MYVVRMHSHTSMFVSQLTHFSYKYTRTLFLLLALSLTLLHCALPSPFVYVFFWIGRPHPMSSKNYMYVSSFFALKIQIATHWFNAFVHERTTQTNRKPKRSNKNSLLSTYTWHNALSYAPHSMLHFVKVEFTVRFQQLSKAFFF